MSSQWVTQFLDIEYSETNYNTFVRSYVYGCYEKNDTCWRVFYNKNSHENAQF